MVFGIGVLALCTGYAALVLGRASYAEVQAMDLLFPFYNEKIRLFSAAEFRQAQLVLSGAGLLFSVMFGVAIKSSSSRQEFKLLGAEINTLWQELTQRIFSLTRTQRLWAGLILVALTVVRVFFSFDNPEYDDAVSYEVFVSKGLLATAAYYPIPNNHVLSNTISVLFHQLSPQFWWSMRVPVLLTCTGVTVFLFAGLLRLAGFRVALAATALFSCLQLGLYHAGVGRGYWLMIGFAGVVFFSTLVLTAKAGRHRAAWAAMTLAGILGCYTVPPFVYVLASAFSWLGIAMIRRRDWPQLGLAVIVGGIIGAGTVALYAPLLFVAGPGHLLGNGYVASLTPARFWAGILDYVWHNEGFLAGQRSLGPLFVTIPVLALVGRLWYLSRQHRLPVAVEHRLWRLGLPALWFMSFPYALIVVQRVFPPERVMLYKAFFFFILVGLVLDWLLTYSAEATRRLLRPLLALAITVFVAYETYSVVRVNPVARASNGAYHAGLQWLAGQPSGPVLIPEPTHNLFFRFYAHSEMPERQWQIDSDQRGTTRYRYVVAFPNKRGYFQPLFNFPPAYQNQEVEIYQVPAYLSLNIKPWFH
ncbi:hypothetical protein BEN47_02220 [Hymenobacter lapidarius]|uniref:Glycosyltransferase RgtA/B/C/D-like domain-containing protein n=1 Tax=Hymenobacter lapidarius TaxID=1908237 RepID=A0A1G1T2S5_9BACT|nr:hypothetical protein BEN47_02220 [Hymenobacter lapidarius]